jgi:hypothetical protein
MSGSSRRYAFLILSSALTVGLLSPAARAQRGRAMNGGFMQSTRPSGMMGMMSRNQGNFPGGFGLNAYRGLAFRLSIPQDWTFIFSRSAPR